MKSNELNLTFEYLDLGHANTNQNDFRTSRHSFNAAYPTLDFCIFIPLHLYKGFLATYLSAYLFVNIIINFFLQDWLQQAICFIL